MTDKRIMVVDDSLETRELLQAMLEEAGYDVSAAQDGETALELVKTKEPYVVLLDVMMPGINGYEVLTRLKAGESTKSIEVIMVSAKGLEEDIQRGLELGACDYISKPFYAELLIKRVGRLFNKLAKG